MKGNLVANLWNVNEANKLVGTLAERVYSSRLLGANTNLVLHGGGNTSVKDKFQTIFGKEDALYVKGSGSDLATIEPKDFVPVRLKTLIQLSQLEQLTDLEMARELKLATLDPAVAAPSVETILHAVIPHRFVDHTHADAILTITNSPNGEKKIREIYGEDVIVLPYVMPGFDLAKLCAQIFPVQAKPHTIGMVLMNHGIFSFGETAKESYDRMIELVGRAENYIQQNIKVSLPTTIENYLDLKKLPILRKDLSQAAGFPLLIKTLTNQNTIAFARHPMCQTISQRGPITPDHIIRTKRIPMLGNNVRSYIRNYQKYFETNAIYSDTSLTMLDPAPRVVIDPEFGLTSVGRSVRDTKIIEEIYLHTQEVIIRSEALGGYIALPEKDLFKLEYWELEQAKLKKSGQPKTFAGEAVLITGAASGIGKACVKSFLNRGAAVIGVDINPSVEVLCPDNPSYLGIVTDLTQIESVNELFNRIINHFGGLDMLILNAGIFPGGQKIDSLTDERWRKVMDINLDANLNLMRQAYSLLKMAPRFGRLLVIGSKNVIAPGPGAAAYSASKAALTQLARVAALEWGTDGIRVNLLHPNAVFDTGIWTEEVLTQRASIYKMTVDEYKRNNVLQVEILSKDVAELAAEMCSPLFAKITGAQIPIDGGNERII
jgi:rhamnose utilization protein RhaD (predicted bifunctional aldolase and dehydrogenase)/NAD(P)-dependent dehydrogenase (short-subunit alcohol dehydrogenase family)